MDRSVFKGKVLTQGEKAALQKKAERQRGKTGSYKMKFGEWAWSFRKLCIKKKKEKDETDAVSYYKPHPHLKCPHMQSVL